MRTPQPSPRPGHHKAPGAEHAQFARSSCDAAHAPLAAASHAHRREPASCAAAQLRELRPRRSGHTLLCTWGRRATCVGRCAGARVPHSSPRARAPQARSRRRASPRRRPRRGAWAEAIRAGAGAAGRLATPEGLEAAHAGRTSSSTSPCSQSRTPDRPRRRRCNRRAWPSRTTHGCYTTAGTPIDQSTVRSARGPSADAAPRAVAHPAPVRQALARRSCRARGRRPPSRQPHTPHPQRSAATCRPPRRRWVARAPKAMRARRARRAVRQGTGWPGRAGSRRPAAASPWRVPGATSVDGKHPRANTRRTRRHARRAPDIGTRAIDSRSAPRPTPTADSREAAPILARHASRSL